MPRTRTAAALASAPATLGSRDVVQSRTSLGTALRRQSVVHAQQCLEDAVDVLAVRLLRHRRLARVDDRRRGLHHRWWRLCRVGTCWARCRVRARRRHQPSAGGGRRCREAVAGGGCVAVGRTHWAVVGPRGGRGPGTRCSTAARSGYRRRLQQAVRLRGQSGHRRIVLVLVDMARGSPSSLTSPGWTGAAQPLREAGAAWSRRPAPGRTRKVGPLPHDPGHWAYLRHCQRRRSQVHIA